MVLHHDKIDDIQVLKYYVMHQHKNVTQERNAEPLSLWRLAPCCFLLSIQW